MKKLFFFIGFLTCSLLMQSQTITSVSPNEGVVGEEMKVILTGNDVRGNGYFRTASTVNDFSFTNQFNNFLSIDSVKIIDELQNQIEILFTIPIDAVVGNYDIKIFETFPNTPTILKNTVLNGFKVLGDIVTTLSSTYQDKNNDGFTSVGDVINIDYTLKNNTNVAITNVNLSSNNTDMTISGLPISVLNAGISDATTFKGKKVITQEEINQGFVNLNSIVTGTRGATNINYNIKRKFALSTSDGIKLNAFLDNNANNVQDQGEENLSDVNSIKGIFSIQLNSGAVQNVSPSTGMYTFYETNPLNSYDLSFTIPAQLAQYYKIVTPTYNAIKVARGSGITTINFAVRENSTFDRIKLNAFFDNNSNNVQDSGESNLDEANFSVQLNSGAIQNVFSTTGTHFIYESNPLNSYKLNYIIPEKYASNYTLGTGTYNSIKVPNGSGTTTINFAVRRLPFNDLSVQVYSQSAPPRPGFMYDNIIQYTNKGNQTIFSGTVTFTKNNVASLSFVSQSGTVSTTNGRFTYNFINLLPNETRTINVTMLVPVIPVVNLGDLLTNSASITSSVTDIDTTNNESSLTQIIVGSYDPNDKAESHGEKIVRSTFTSNDYLFYTIRFENTGTAEAINIRITDELDAKLDENTIESITTSNKDYVLERVGKNLTWRFNGINLPPSTPNSTTIGHGSVVFKIKPKAGYAVGDIINNTANIYFDFNPAIVTNTWKTEFVNTLSTNDIVFNDLKVYPNPTTNLLMINSNSTIEKIEISSLEGKKIVSQKVNTNQHEVSLKELSKGVYFVKISANGSEKVVKIIKE